MWKELPQMGTGYRFYHKPPFLDLDWAIMECHRDEYKQLFMPGFIDSIVCSTLNSEIRRQQIATQSMWARAETKKKTLVEIYAHVPNYFSHLDESTELHQMWVTEGFSQYFCSIRRMPNDQISELLKLEDGENVIVIDAKEAMKWPNGPYGIDKPESVHMAELKGKVHTNGESIDMIAGNNPRLRAMLGGKDRLDKYLKWAKGFPIFSGAVHVRHPPVTTNFYGPFGDLISFYCGDFFYFSTGMDFCPSYGGLVAKPKYVTQDDSIQVAPIVQQRLNIRHVNIIRPPIYHPTRSSRIKKTSQVERPVNITKYPVAPRQNPRYSPPKTRQRIITAEATENYARLNVDVSRLEKMAVEVLLQPGEVFKIMGLPERKLEKILAGVDETTFVRESGSDTRISLAPIILILHNNGNKEAETAAEKLNYVYFDRIQIG